MGNPTKVFELADFQKAYEGMTSSLVCECSFSTEVVGGMPATPDQMEAFVKYHLAKTDASLKNDLEAAEVVRRLKEEEVGTRNENPGEGELDEKTTYGVNVIRRDEVYGPWLGNWMIKACIKQSASRLGLFQQIRGSKGNFAETGMVKPAGVSELIPSEAWKVFLRDPSGQKQAETFYQKFMGRVNTPQGPVSIIHDSECARPGTRFSFEFRLIQGSVTDEDLRDTLALAMICGLGSAKSLERGKFQIHQAVYTEASNPRLKRQIEATKPSRRAAKVIEEVREEQTKDAKELSKDLVAA